MRTSKNAKLLGTSSPLLAIYGISLLQESTKCDIMYAIIRARGMTMNITFLIGNGFDLNLGLDTRYTDFLSKYKEDVEKGEEYFKERVLEDLPLWANAEEAFGAVTKKFKEDGYDAETFCNCHEDFCVKLAEYLLAQEQRLNYSALNSTIVPNFAKAILNYKNGFRDNERDILREAEKQFSGGYIFSFINFNYTQTLDLCVEAVKNQAGVLGTRAIGGNRLNNSIGSIIHVHGTVHDDIVLGVNDESQISDITLFDGFGDEYCSQIIKQKTNEINQRNTDSKTHTLLKNSDLIYVYGMSTGVTDSLWWKRICALMQSKRNIHLILHRYGAPKDELIRRRLITYIKNERNEFLKYCENDEQRLAIQDRIHIDRTNLFESISNLVDNEANTKLLVSV